MVGKICLVAVPHPAGSTHESFTKSNDAILNRI